jgi:hypothetical protein
MTPTYIHSAVCISAQPTFGSGNLPLKYKEVSGKTVEAIHPNYKEYISPIAMRRMVTGVKMGVAAANKALENANIQQLDAILTGTGMGCIEDTEKFLNALISNDEEFLTPTSFIKSTHNTVGAQIALGMQCKAYNNTYVHGALSFESALLDAQLLLQQEEADKALVGGIDELGTEFVKVVRMMEDKQADGIKVPLGEGASFFVLSSNYRKNSVKLLSLESFSAIPINSILDKIKAFLTKNSLELSEIDILITGNNGDAYDNYYNTVVSAFPNTTIPIVYKHFCGEFYTASAFGFYLAHEILKSQQIPEGLIKNRITKPSFKTILLYNQFKGRDHSFVLLSI